MTVINRFKNHIPFLACAYLHTSSKFESQRVNFTVSIFSVEQSSPHSPYFH